MTITVLYFASLREFAGRPREDMDAEGIRCALDVWRRAQEGRPLPPGTLIAVNQEYAAADHPVREGDEVAFFPPVTGG
ncbi:MULTISPECIES: MoaD/ThiS family protein [Ectothiorhodospira]|uniref:MoaD/ThiS family protein n=1 Tax=Ectothiorhodospira TaxID=1051 RepID=UPI00024A86FE|nr:MoaD/ThiS family protein [Ectothiorhodospira sp. PHS-1]EHQ52899.1 molybdopterin converting factor, subunit 1 [Ectothiorhodospira sp. PHS-1]MCG5512202.1 MoaD/ThiS family protein [Ectothiorhodospira shaposhnikovii]